MKQMLKTRGLALLVMMSTLNGQEFVKKTTKSRTASKSSMQEECVTGVADIFSIANDCARKAVDIERACMEMLGTSFCDTSSKLAVASKEELKAMNTTVTSVKERCAKIRDELSRMEKELKALKL